MKRPWLTGGPELLRIHREVANAVPAALVTTAIDGVRLCNTAAAPMAFVRDAVPGYLTAVQRARQGDWFTLALAKVVKPVRGISALTPLRQEEGIGEPDHLQPHDFLVQHVGSEHTAVPETAWTALLAHIHDPHIRMTVSTEAEKRGLLRIAAEALFPVAVADPDGTDRMVRLLGQHPDRVEWQRFGAARGVDGCLWSAAMDAGERGDRKEAARLWRRHVEQTNGRYMSDQVGFLAEQDLLDDAVEWLRPAAESGDETARDATVRLLREAGRHAEAVKLLRPLAVSGNEDAALQLAWIHHETNNLTEYRRWLTPLAENGNTSAIRSLAELQEGDALEWTRRAAELGSKWAVKALADPLEEQGHLREAAEIWLRRDRLHASMLLERGGQFDRAAELWRRGAEAGNQWDMSMLGGILQAAGHTEQAEHWLRKAAEAGNDHDLVRLSEFLADTGRTADALTTWADRVAIGDQDAVVHSADVLIRSGRADEGRVLLEEHAERGSVACMRVLAARFQSDVWLERAARAGHAESAKELARRLRDAGDPHGATDVLQLGAAHDRRAANLLTSLLVEANEVNEAEQRHRDQLECAISTLSTLAEFLRRQVRQPHFAVGAIVAGRGVVGCGGGTNGRGLGGVVATRPSAGGGFQVGVGG